MIFEYYNVLSVVCFFFFNDTATTEIYTLSLHDALPISHPSVSELAMRPRPHSPASNARSEEHTSELQSRLHLVCRLLLEKKKKNTYTSKLVKETKKIHYRQNHIRST